MFCFFNIYRLQLPNETLSSLAILIKRKNRNLQQMKVTTDQIQSHKLKVTKYSNELNFHDIDCENEGFVNLS